MTSMPPSPKGRFIEWVAGDPTAIVNRGRAISELGQKMQDSATVLQGLAEGTHGLRGKAVDPLVEGVGVVHGTLREAGQPCEPTGPVVRDYGLALRSLKPNIAATSTRAACSGTTSSRCRGSVEPRGTGGLFQPEADSPEADEQQAEDAAKREAYEAWVAEATLYDEDSDDWSDAFDTATRDVGTALAGTIEDSFWDDLAGFVAGALEVLKWVGLALAIAGLIIGGPLIGLLSGIVGLLVLGVTIDRTIRGDADWLELGLAIFGAIPFGSLSKVFSKPRQAFFGGVFSSKGRGDAGMELKGIFRAGSGAGGGLQGLRAGWTQFVNQGETGLAPNMISRIFTGKGAIAIGQAHPVDILAGTWMTTLGRINTVMSSTTGEGLYSRIVTGGGS